MSKEIEATTAKQVPAGTTPNDLIAIALQSGASMDQLDKLLDLQIRYQENERVNQAIQAKNSFVAAMAKFKANAPDISKDKSVGYHGKDGAFVGYKHATLGNVAKKINAALGEHGLSAAWQIDQESADIKVTCVITHKDGHSESTSLTAKADNSGKKNQIQQIASTITYLERYTLLAITGCATCEQDDDGVAGGQEEKISLDKFMEGVSHFKSENFCADDLQRWIDSKEDDIERSLTHKEFAELDKHYKESINWLDENGKHATSKAPKTFTCASGLEVTPKDCESCPKNGGCNELKTHLGE